jgi:crotonobetainyl-CoA:carnitine CoA-transferase CaiB-like acyl-CoA transferase
MSQRSSHPPFAGIRILDFTRYVAGPFGTYQLALLGADVIKIEPKAGDDMRHSQLSPEWAAKGLGPSFLGINANKRSLTLDLSKPQAVAIVKRLTENADIVWENFLPPGGHAAVRAGLGDAARAEPAADLLRRLRLRPERPGARHRGVRWQIAGDVRHHVDHRPRG